MNHRRFQSRPVPPLRAFVPSCLRAFFRPALSLSKGFTLVEVMLSLLIAMILLYGMNRVFSDTSNAIRAGTALSEATRNGRAAQPVLFNDLNNCAPDSPAFIISSQLVHAYLNPADYAANGGLGIAGNGCELGDHFHRADQVMFFARGLYKRKTANGPNVSPPLGYTVSTTTSDEAYVHYGHLRILSDGITPVGPGDTIVNGAFINKPPTASEWVLGRNVILLADANNVLANDYDLGGLAGGIHEVYYPRQSTPQAPWTAHPTGTLPPSYPANLAPLGWNSLDNAPSGTTTIQSSRYDLAGVTIDQMRGIITNAAAAQSVEPLGFPYCTWWSPLVYEGGFASAVFAGNNPPKLPPAIGTIPNRFQASNVLSPTPMSPQDQANLAPYMLEHVSQFIVEYAGDFVTENAAGGVTDTVPDGQIDWYSPPAPIYNNLVAYPSGAYVQTSIGSQYYQAGNTTLGAGPPGGVGWTAVNPPHQIRWYGMPRDENGTGHVYSLSATNNTNNLLANVVPLDEIWRSSTANSTRPLPYEVELPRYVGGGVAPPADYATGMSATSRYTAVWRNDVPAMVRILLKLDDPTSALQDGPWFEYVFKLK